MRNEWDEGRSGNGQGRELTIRDSNERSAGTVVVSSFSPYIPRLTYSSPRVAGGTRPFGAYDTGKE